jgi:pimeloyl-ACP methyl ester carboxylesterase
VLAAVALTGGALCAPVQAAGGERLRVGALVLHRCGDGKSGWCGSLPRPLDPARPLGSKIGIGLRWLPATGRARRPTLVTVEGGPGYPSIGSLSEYQAMFGPLRRDRDMLLVDNRGTGSSALIDCPRLQAFTGVTSGPAFPAIVAGCAGQLARRYRGVHAPDLFATAYAAADLDAVLRALRIESIDLYGDSYGTYFAQSFVSRYRDRLHSVILDSAYPVRGLDPWYASSGPVAREALDAVCARDPGCSAAAPGSATARLAALLDLVRVAPITGATRDADGARGAARVDSRTLVDMVQDAASDPVILRELDASVRAALAGDSVPLLRLAAQSNTFDHGTSSAGYFSTGLYMAVSCTDYPQLFSLAASPAQRRRQLAIAAGRPPPGDPFAPFTVAEWVRMSAYSEPYAACLDWPAPHRFMPPVPPKAPPPLPASIPLLVIGGDLDSLTPLSDAQDFAPKLARRVRVVALRNTVHVVSEGDTFLSDGARCARRILRGFLRAPRRVASLDARCAARIATIHTPGAYPLDLADAAEATVVSGPDPGPVTRRAVTVAAGALADATIRRYYSGADGGPGLRGGTFTAGGDKVVRLGLRGVRFVRDAPVDGTASWAPSDGGVFGSVTVRVPDGTRVAVRLDWTQRRRMARAQVGGTRLELPAP